MTPAGRRSARRKGRRCSIRSFPPTDIWKPDPFDVESIHAEARDVFARTVDPDRPGGTPRARVRGQRGQDFVAAGRERRGQNAPAAGVPALLALAWVGLVRVLADDHQHRPLPALHAAESRGFAQPALRPEPRRQRDRLAAAFQFPGRAPERARRAAPGIARGGVRAVRPTGFRHRRTPRQRPAHRRRGRAARRHPHPALLPAQGTRLHAAGADVPAVRPADAARLRMAGRDRRPHRRRGSAGDARADRPAHAPLRAPVAGAVPRPVGGTLDV